MVRGVASSEGFLNIPSTLFPVVSQLLDLEVGVVEGSVRETVAKAISRGRVELLVVSVVEVDA